MFYVIAQMWFWLVLAAFLGLVVGWLLRGGMLTARLNKLEDDVLMARAARDRAEQDNKRISARLKGLESVNAHTPDRSKAAPAKSAAASGDEDAAGMDPGGKLDTSVVSSGVRPPALKAPRSGQADDLQQIRGIGDKLEEMLHQLGIYHVDQIANWSREHVAWIDGYLRFQGRIDREQWIEQARAISERSEAGDNPSASA